MDILNYLEKRKTLERQASTRSYAEMVISGTQRDLAENFSNGLEDAKCHIEELDNEFIRAIIQKIFPKSKKKDTLKEVSDKNIIISDLSIDKKNTTFNALLVQAQLGIRIQRDGKNNATKIEILEILNGNKNYAEITKDGISYKNSKGEEVEKVHLAKALFAFKSALELALSKL